MKSQSVLTQTRSNCDNKISKIIKNGKSMVWGWAKLGKSFILCIVKRISHLFYIVEVYHNELFRMGTQRILKPLFLT